MGYKVKLHGAQDTPGLMSHKSLAARGALKIGTPPSALLGQPIPGRSFGLRVVQLKSSGRLSRRLSTKVLRWAWGALAFIAFSLGLVFAGIIYTQLKL